MFNPAKSAQMTTRLLLQIPTGEKYINGVLVKSYSAAGQIVANFATFGGTEITSNGILAVEDTATVTTWYRPDIKSGCRVVRLTDNAAFDVIGEPENVEMRNKYLIFKVRRVKGGA